VRPQEMAKALGKSLERVNALEARLEGLETVVERLAGAVKGLESSVHTTPVPSQEESQAGLNAAEVLANWQAWKDDVDRRMAAATMPMIVPGEATDIDDLGRYGVYTIRGTMPKPPILMDEKICESGVNHKQVTQDSGQSPESLSMTASDGEAAPMPSDELRGSEKSVAVEALSMTPSRQDDLAILNSEECQVRQDDTLLVKKSQSDQKRTLSMTPTAVQNLHTDSGYICSSTPAPVAQLESAQVPHSQRVTYQR